jgi:hypothetical protein
VPASILRSVQQPGGPGRLWWLPANGHGNGLDDEAWAPIIDADADTARRLLTALRDLRIPAYAAPLPAARGVRHRARRPGGPACRLWVGTSAYGRAEQALLTLLPNLPGGSDHARR